MLDHGSINRECKMIEKLKALKPKQFDTTHVAKFREIDPYGHMNTVYYLDYFIEHRFEGMRSIGIDLHVINDLPVAFFMKTVKLDLAMPVLAEEHFKITSKVSDIHEKGAIVLCDMVSCKTEKKHASCQFDLICVDKKNQRPCPWPYDFMALFFETNEVGAIN